MLISDWSSDVCSSDLQEAPGGGTKMTLMPAAEAAVRVMEKEGVSAAFGVPGAAINPLYAAMKKRRTIDHVLARHVEAASHMAEGSIGRASRREGVCKYG